MAFIVQFLLKPHLQVDAFSHAQKFFFFYLYLSIKIAIKYSVTLTCPGFRIPVSSMTPIIRRASEVGRRMRARFNRFCIRSLYNATSKDLKKGSFVNSNPASDRRLYPMPVFAPDTNCRVASFSSTSIPIEKKN